MSDTPQNNAPEFAPTSLEAWAKAAAKSAPGGDVNALNWVTPDGITVKPLYTSADTKDLPYADTLPGFESNTWFGLYGPKGLPAEVVSRVNAAANQALSDPEVRAKLTTLGIEAVTSTPAQFAKMVADDQAKWKRIIAERKIVNE